MLSRLARECAAEISSHDWSDAPYRFDRAGHQRHWDSRATDAQLDQRGTENVLLNVMAVTAQVLRNLDPNFDVHEFAEACGVPPSRRLNSNGKPSGVITSGLRWNHEQPGVPLPPGAPLQCVVMQCTAPNLIVFKRLLKEVGAMNPGCHRRRSRKPRSTPPPAARCAPSPSTSVTGTPIEPRPRRRTWCVAPVNLCRAEGL